MQSDKAILAGLVVYDSALDYSEFTRHLLDLRSRGVKLSDQIDDQEWKAWIKNNNIPEVEVEIIDFINQLNDKFPDPLVADENRLLNSQ